MSRPISIENRWDILYRDYPEVYEAFASHPYSTNIEEQLPRIVDLQGKSIADVGAGTGKSSFMLAKYARKVYGIEQELAMLEVAKTKGETPGSGLVEYIAGDALAIPLADEAVELVTAITLALYPFSEYRRFIQEGLRVARERVIYEGIPPGWYGGELFDLIEDPDKDDDEVDRIFLNEYSFEYKDFYATQDYGTVENITSTYGFIFGKSTIDYLRVKGQTTIKWKFRVYWKDK